MKTPKVAIISIALLLTILIGAIAVNVFSAPPALKLKVKWKPAEFTMDSWIPDPWLAEIYFAPPRPITEIDPSTLKLESTYSPITTYPHAIKDRLVVEFRGYDVLTCLVNKAPHMQPGTFEIFLEIEGRLYDGRYFSGSGSINMTVPEYPPP
jgi:hypothetical protein